MTAMNLCSANYYAIQLNLSRCNHGRAIEYYLESIKIPCFRVRQVCSETKNMSVRSNCISTCAVMYQGVGGSYRLSLSYHSPGYHLVITQLSVFDGSGYTG